MVEFPQESNLAEYSLAVNVVIEHIFYTFDCYLASSGVLNSPAYTSIASGSQDSFHQIIWANLPVWKLGIFLWLCNLLNLYICAFFIEISSVSLHCLGWSNGRRVIIVDPWMYLRSSRLLRVRILIHMFRFCGEIFALISLYYLFKCKNIWEFHYD